MNKNSVRNLLLETVEQKDQSKHSKEKHTTETNKLKNWCIFTHKTNQKIT